MMDLEINILRGAENIGENLIEASDGKSKILIECGVALNPTEKTKEIEQKVLATHYDAIIISHSHLDHAGLLKSEVNADSIYMGKSTYELLCYTDVICAENRHRVKLFENNDSFFVGEIEIKPYLCDHSAYDSYMIEIKKGNKSILYTGDFRSNGRKSFNALLQRLPSKVDTLITEATNPYEYNHTERYLEDKATEIMKKHKRVFFLQSRLNVDRLVSFYRATRREGKPFIMERGSAEISRIGKNIPSPLVFDDCYTYLKHKVNNFEYTSSKDKYKQKLIGRRDIARMDEFSMQVTAGMGDYLERLAELTDLNGSALIYSMWHGYKESENTREFLKKAEALGMEIIDLHVSGHADKNTQKRLVERVSPGKIIAVHKDSKTDDFLRLTTVIDIETDGLNYDESKGEVDRIIKIEASKIENGKIIEHFSTFVKNDRALGSLISDITGIKNEDLKNAPSIVDALANLYLFAYGTKIAVYNASFVLGFLNYYSEKIKAGFFDVIDIRTLIIQKLNGKIRKYRVKEALEYFNCELGKSTSENEARLLIFLENKI